MKLLKNKTFLSMMLGVLWSAPFLFESMWPLAVLSLIFMVYALSEYNTVDLIKYGSLVIFVQNIIAVYWMKALSPVAWILVALILASEFAVFAYLFASLRKRVKRQKNILWLIPFAWYLYEYSRGLGMFKWSWTNLGNWLTWNSDNMAFASVVGLSLIHI